MAAAEDHDGLNSEFSLIGAFWEPETPESVLTGTLTSNNGEITFTTAPQYQPKGPLPTTVFSIGGGKKSPALHGFTERGICTLCDVFEISHQGLTDNKSMQAIESVAHSVSACVTGLHIRSSEDKCLSSASYSFSGLSHWLPKATSSVWAEDSVTLKIPTQSKSILDFSILESKTRIKVNVFSPIEASLADGTRVGESHAYVEVESLLPESLDWYYQIGSRLENLFSLLTGASLTLEQFFVHRGNDSGYVNSKRESRAQPFDPRECVWSTWSQLANCIDIWLSESIKFRRVEALALGVLRKRKLFLETEFLSLAQALEGIHRATEPATIADSVTFGQVRKKIATFLRQENVDSSLSKRISDSIAHANELTFASRLMALCQCMGHPLLERMGIKPDEFVADVVQKRNSLTHIGGKTRRRAAQESFAQLFEVTQQMRPLLRGVLLRHLGIPTDQFQDVLARQANMRKILG
jgi:hypothetical protein